MSGRQGENALAVLNQFEYKAFNDEKDHDGFHWLQVAVRYCNRQKITVTSVYAQCGAVGSTVVVHP